MLEGVKSAFRFYEEIENQTFRRCACEEATGVASAFRLVTNSEIILPFQIKRAANAAPIVSFELYEIDQTTGAETSVKDMFSVFPFDGAGFWDILNFTSEEYILYYNDTPTPGLLPEGGPYYFRISDGFNVWFSEVFFSEAFDLSAQNCYLDVSFYNSCALGGLYFDPNDAQKYAQRLFLKSDLSEPEYLSEEEGAEDSLGAFKAEFKKLTKRYNFEVLAPEFIADALNGLTLFDNVTIRLLSGQTISLTSENNLEALTTWTGAGCFAIINTSFEFDLIPKTNCCKPELIVNEGFCLPIDIEVKRSIAPGFELAFLNNFGVWFNEQTLQFENAQIGDQFLIFAPGGPPPPGPVGDIQFYNGAGLSPDPINLVNTHINLYEVSRNKFWYRWPTAPPTFEFFDITLVDSLVEGPADVWTITGRTFKDSFVNIELRYPLGGPADVIATPPKSSADYIAGFAFAEIFGPPAPTLFRVNNFTAFCSLPSTSFLPLLTIP